MIDDVGPAVAELDKLLDLPFTAIKLDKTLVQQLETAPDVAREVERIIVVAGARGMTVVAEGVETVAVWHRLRALGVNQAQGFLIASPLPAAPIPAWVESWRQRPGFDPGFRSQFLISPAPTPAYLRRRLTPCVSAAEPALALLKCPDGTQEIDLAERRPQHVREVELAVGALPQQEA